MPSEELIHHLELKKSLELIARIVISSFRAAACQIVVNGGNFIKEHSITVTGPTTQLSESPLLISHTPIISSRGNHLGLLALMDNNHRHFEFDDQSLMAELAKICASTIEKHYEVQQMHQVVTDFIHKAVHDLKNPFTTISLSTELLKRKADDHKMVNSFAERIEKGSQKALKNLETLKQAFPLISESFKPNMQEINVEQLLLAAKAHFPKRSISVENTAKKTFLADYERLIIALSLTVDLLPAEENIFTKAYNDESTVFFELSSPIKPDNYLRSNSWMISKMLIELHKGNINEICNDEAAIYGFQISLPLVTP